MPMPPRPSATMLTPCPTPNRRYWRQWKRFSQEESPVVKLVNKLVSVGVRQRQVTCYLAYPPHIIRRACSLPTFFAGHSWLASCSRNGFPPHFYLSFRRRLADSCWKLLDRQAGLKLVCAFYALPSRSPPLHHKHTPLSIVTTHAKEKHP